MTQPQPTKTRRQKLEEFVAARPNDAFTLYALALECANEGDSESAIQHFDVLLRTHPDYVTGYFQLGQLYMRLSRFTEARQTLTAGVAAAGRAGDSHAAEEMSAAIASLPAGHII